MAKKKKKKNKRRSKKRYDWFDISNQDKEDWEKICPVNEYRILKPADFPNILPNSLVDKYDSIFIMASGSNNGVAYYMANGNRVDFNDNAIDQQPFGLAFIGDETIPSGSLIQHGDWEDRTTEPPDEFWNHISCSGIGTCYPLSELPSTESGSIEDLNINSQKDAFNDLVKSLKKFTKE